MDEAKPDATPTRSDGRTVGKLVGAATLLERRLAKVQALLRPGTRWLDKALRRAAAADAPDDFRLSAARVCQTLGERLRIEAPARALDRALHGWLELNGHRFHSRRYFVGGGDWNRISDDFTRNHIFREVYELSLNGWDFRATKSYDLYRRKMAAGKPVVRSGLALDTPERIDAYFRRYAELADSIRAHGLLRHEAAAPDVPGAARARLACLQETGIGVAIDAAGRPLRLPNGQHRLAIAWRLKGVPMVPAEVRLVHRDWLRRVLAAAPDAGPVDALAAAVRRLEADWRHAALAAWREKVREWRLAKKRRKAKSAEPPAQPVGIPAFPHDWRKDMNERPGIVTFNGEPLTLLGPALRVGAAAPDFTAVRGDLSPANLSDWQGRTIIVSSVPSLDTPVCDIQTRRFNTEAAKQGTVVVTVSMDLPFAQARWCGSAGLPGIVTVSDHRDADFGRKWGLLIKELRLLARAVAVVDPEGKIKYLQIVPEMTNEPDYDAALAAARA